MHGRSVDDLADRVELVAIPLAVARCGDGPSAAEECVSVAELRLKADTTGQCR
jgi:hypothetical protein